MRDTWRPGEAHALARLGTFIEDRLANYAEDRSRLDIGATSLLSPHLHFGEISPNQVWHAVTHAMSANAVSATSGPQRRSVREDSVRDGRLRVVIGAKLALEEP